MTTKHPVAGSEQTHPDGARCIGACDPDQRIEVIVMLRRKDEAGFRALMQQIDAGKAPPVPVSHDAFADRFGASQSDIDATQRFAQAHGLTVARVDAAQRSVVLSGTIAQFERAFDVKLERFEHKAIGEYRGREGAVHVPDEIHPMVKAVLGLDSRPQARPHFRLRHPLRPTAGLPDGGDSTSTSTTEQPTFRPPFRPAATDSQLQSFTPIELASLYGFPQGDASGQCIALIELGGGYTSSDLDAYFSGLGTTRPKVIDVSVDDSTNQPTGDPNGPDGEVTLDIEIAGAIAPAATIAVYFSQNSDAGFVDALNQAIHDTTNTPSVVSISWGSPEANWTSQSINAFNDVLQSAAALGVTICAASGDSGSSDGSNDGSNQVDFPASSPYVLACGGTHLSASNASISSETVWNDGAQGGAGGGGISTVFAVPAWQKGLSATFTQGKRAVALTHRGVPDVAADASPQSGYDILVGGQSTVVGGTSAVAPLWAALIARINGSRNGAVGFVNAKLYAAKSVGHDITRGNNGAFEATAGWDACTGLGSPDGTKVAQAIA